MCGLYGFIGKPTKKTTGIVQQLGILNETRGKDSTGLAVFSGGFYEVQKKAVNSSTFFDKLHMGKLISSYRKSDFMVVMGHTRLATHGAITDSNAHPFTQGDIIFSHNGIITNFNSLQSKFKTEFEVDSQIIGHLLNEKDYQKAFKALSGMFAIPYVDIKDTTMLNVAVHNQIFAYAVKGKHLFYSSDIKHLRQLLKGKGYMIAETANNSLYRFYAIHNGNIVVSKEPIEAGSSYGYELMPYANEDYSTLGWVNRRNRVWNRYNWE